MILPALLALAMLAGQPPAPPQPPLGPADAVFRIQDNAGAIELSLRGDGTVVLGDGTILRRDAAALPLPVALPAIHQAPLRAALRSLATPGLAAPPKAQGASVAAPASDQGSHRHKLHDELANTMLFYVVINAGDIYSTAYGLDRCAGRCEEGNPLGFNSEARGALKAAGVAVIGYLDYKLRRRGAHKPANILRAVVVAGTAAIIANNVRRAHQ